MCIGVLGGTRTPAYVAALVAKQSRRGGQRLDIPAVAVDEDEARRPLRRGPAELDEQKSQRRGPDRDGTREPLVLADRGREGAIGFIAVSEPVSNRASDGSSDPSIRVQRKVRAMLFDRTDRDNQRRRRALQLSRR